MAAIQIVSDLHLENPKAYDTYRITPGAPYLALLGDIGCGRDPAFLNDFVTAQLAQFRIVLLDRTEYTLPEHPDVTILGRTLYSKIPADQAKVVRMRLNDFNQIDNWMVENHDAMHVRDLAWLNQRVESISREAPDRKIIVLTHRSPTRDARAGDPRHANSPIAAGFSTELRGESCWESSTVKLQAFEHTHWNCDYTDERTGKKVFTNQRGYGFQQSVGFRPDAIVKFGELNKPRRIP